MLVNFGAETSDLKADMPPGMDTGDMPAQRLQTPDLA